jgi:hypothetical protein
MEREGFRALPPPGHPPRGRTPLRAGDWVASARNVSQLDFGARLAPAAFRAIAHWERPGRGPLRVSHADSGASFWSHRIGYLPYAFGRAPLERFQLAQVLRIER